MHLESFVNWIQTTDPGSWISLWINSKPVHEMLISLLLLIYVSQDAQLTAAISRTGLMPVHLLYSQCIGRGIHTEGEGDDGPWGMESLDQAVPEVRNFTWTLWLHDSVNPPFTLASLVFLFLVTEKMLTHSGKRRWERGRKMVSKTKRSTGWGHERFVQGHRTYQ